MRKSFLTGLVFLLPVAVTIVLVMFIVDVLTQPFLGIMEHFLSQFPSIKRNILFFHPDQVLRILSQVTILVLLFFFTVIVGIIARWFFFKWIIKIGDHVIHRIPLINKLYKTLKEMIQTIFSTQANAFRQVVLVPFPNSSVYSVGLIAKQAPEVCRDLKGEDLMTVFVPTAPNPTTGYLMMYPKKNIILTEMPVEDAVKYVVSCGVIGTVQEAQ